MPTDATNPFGARATSRFGDETAVVYRLSELARQGLAISTDFPSPSACCWKTRSATSAAAS